MQREGGKVPVDVFKVSDAKLSQSTEARVCAWTGFVVLWVDADEQISSVSGSRLKL